MIKRKPRTILIHCHDCNKDTKATYVDKYRNNRKGNLFDPAWVEITVAVFDVLKGSEKIWKCLTCGSTNIDFLEEL